MSKTKIYWLSRHQPLQSQINELRRIYGDDVEIIPDPNPFEGADEIIRRFRESGADEILVVAPLSVIAQLVQRGIKPLWAEMEVVNDPAEAETEASGRYYRFKRFRRIVRVVMEFEDL